MCRAMRGRPSPTVQFGGALRKNLLHKQRNLRNTCCELCSPLVMILLLAVGFSLSDIFSFPAKIYAQFDFRLPDDFESVGYAATGGTLQQDDLESIQSLLSKVLSGPVPTPTFDQYVTVGSLISNNLGDDLYTNALRQTSYGQEFGNLITLGTLHFAPARERTFELMNYLNQTTLRFDKYPKRVHDSEGDAIRYIEKHVNDERAWAVVVLDEMEPGNVDYTLRMNFTTLPNTNWLVSYISLGLDDRYFRYYLSGFHTLARTIDDFAFSLNASAATDEPQCVPPSMTSVPFPTPEYDQNFFYTAVGYLLGLVMTMATMYPMSRLIKDLVEEKETAMRETMAAMGMSLVVNGTAWFVVALANFTAVALVITLIASTSFFPRSDPLVVFLFFWLFCMSEVTLAFLVSACFSRAKLAAIIGPVVLFAACLPRYIFFGTNRYEAVTQKYFASLLSPSAFCFGADVFGDYEYANVGVGFDNIDDDSFSLLSCLQMMAFDTVLYAALAAYLEEVWPTQYGSPQHPLFCLRAAPAWLAGCLAMVVPGWGGDQPRVLQEAALVKVRLSGLVKRWTSRGRPAVNDLSLELQEGQITCLLGPNGAGKSTTVAMLTGLTPPTHGDGTIYGRSLRHELPEVRRDLGVCPQKNVLFPSLTVREHLAFFAAVRGMTGDEARTAVKDMATAVDLSFKLDARADALSGGMKRKLCLGMAFMGNPRFVILDEVSSGLDPLSRRAIWELLRRARRGRVILFTTHFLDEADILADKIAIITRGRLRCFGTSLFLKRQFGVGYNLTCVLGQGQNQHAADLQSMTKAAGGAAAVEPEAAALADAAAAEEAATEHDYRPTATAAAHTLDNPGSDNGSGTPAQSGALVSFVQTFVPNVQLGTTAAKEVQSATTNINTIPTNNETNKFFWGCWHHRILVDEPVTVVQPTRRDSPCKPRCRPSNPWLLFAVVVPTLQRVCSESHSFVALCRVSVTCA